MCAGLVVCLEKLRFLKCFYQILILNYELLKIKILKILKLLEFNKKFIKKIKIKFKKITKAPKFPTLPTTLHCINSHIFYCNFFKSNLIV